ncbi:MAG TPA: hypothetical protein VHQ65_17020 [Thermoanaerobaculia bacterium]|nr:hypothetical protein [Thermoanaerobaculia bacterium]
MRRPIPWTLALLIVLAAPAFAAQQPRPAAPAPAPAPAPAEPPAVRLAMDEVGQLAGTWEGEGWIRMGAGEPVRFRGKETVEPRLGGRVLVIEGVHHGAESGELAHHALAVLAPAEEGDGYRFHTWLANGRGGEYPAYRDGDDLVWEMESPRGPIRYTIAIDDFRWHEVGEIQIDGTWQRFFEMTLKRVSEPRPRR